jgi:hypothetical protein
VNSIFKVTPVDNPTIEQYKATAMRELNDFFPNKTWAHNTPKVFIADDRKTIDSLCEEETKPWVVGLSWDRSAVFILNPENISKESNQDGTKYNIQKLIKHELCHSFFALNFGRSSFSWISEGVALYVADQLTDYRTPMAFKDFLEDKPKNVYAEAGFAIKLLVDNFGKEKVFEFLKKQNGIESREDLGALFEKVFENKLGYDYFNKLLNKDNKETLEVKAPTLQEEFNHLKHALKQKAFYEQNGYRPVYPDVEELKNPAVLNDEIFKEKEFDPSFYENGVKAIEANRELILKCISKLSVLPQHWNFKYLRKYTVQLTRYGPGGSYHADTGTIIMLTNKAGEFKRGTNPAHTIIHEIVHIGIEDGIVTKFGLTHWEKERLVDLLVKKLFDKELPDYKMQDIENTKMDGFIKDVESLPEEVEKYISADGNKHASGVSPSSKPPPEKSH